MKNLKDPNRNQTRHLPAWRTVPQPSYCVPPQICTYMNNLSTQNFLKLIYTWRWPKRMAETCRIDTCNKVKFLKKILLIMSRHNGLNFIKKKKSCTLWRNSRHILTATQNYKSFTRFFNVGNTKLPKNRRCFVHVGILEWVKSSESNGLIWHRLAAPRNNNKLLILVFLMSVLHITHAFLLSNPTRCGYSVWHEFSWKISEFAKCFLRSLTCKHSLNICFRRSLKNGF